MINKYYINSKNNENIICTLCPHFCLLKEGERGKCFVRQAKNNEIILESYGHLTHISVESIEKKPFLHFLEGSKTLSIAHKGNCNLQCNFCENFEYTQSQNTNIESKYFSPEDIVLLAKKEECRSICMTYNEPTIYYEYLMDLKKECHLNNLFFIIKTNAYINYKPWADICFATDAMTLDWKGTDEDYKRFGADKYVIEDRIKEAYEKGVHLEISIPLHYYFIKKIDVFHDFGKFISSIDKKMPVHLLKIYPANKDEEYPSTSNEFIIEAQKVLSNYLDNIHIFD